MANRHLIRQALTTPVLLATLAVSASAATEHPCTVVARHLRPDLAGPGFTWFAVVIILLLTIQSRPILCWRNLDAIALALMPLLLMLRDGPEPVSDAAGGLSLGWWAHLLLVVIGLYWLARGLALLASRTARPLQPNVSQRGLVILALAGLVLAFVFLTQAPLSAGSRDGLVGGVYAAETGKLPYGDAPGGHDGRSPLLYLLHAGAVKLFPASCAPDGEPVPLRWDNREQWLTPAGWKTLDPGAIRAVNALLFVLLLAALAAIGHRMHSADVGLTLAALLCFFPPALECLARPEIMLPTVLLAWSVLFATLPGVGGVLSTLLLTLTGLAWPWAWLVLPVLVAYHLRRGWQALWAPVGAVAGLGAIVAGLLTLVAPALPRQQGALAGAGLTPGYTARLSDDGIPIIERCRSNQPAESDFKAWLWRLLLRSDQVRPDPGRTKLALPNGLGTHEPLYRDIAAAGAARATLQAGYRTSMSEQPLLTRLSAAARTLLEATWKPEVVPEQPRAGTWELWAGSTPDSAQRWTWIRRISKLVVGLLSLLVAVFLLRGPRGQFHRLGGALLTVSAGTLLVSWLGAATNWVWLLPAVAVLLATRAEAPRADAPPLRALNLPPFERGPAPRITVEQ